MKLLKNEAYKLFIKRHFLIILIICFSAEALIAFFTANGKKLDDVNEQKKYDYYMSAYSGELTEEKQDEIYKLMKDDEVRFTEKKKLNQQYIDREISDEKYETKLKEFNEYTIGHNGFNIFIQDYQNAVENNKYLLDQKPWEVLFNNESIDFILVLLLIISAILLSVYDEESGANNITFTTEKGKGHKWFVQLAILILTAIFASIFISIIRYVFVDVVYNLDNYNFKINNIEIFYESVKDMTLLQSYFYISIIKTLGAVYLAIIAFSIGSILKQSLLTIFTSFLIVFLPNYVFANREYKYLIPLPSAFLTGNGYFFGDKIYDIIYFKALSTFQVTIIATTAAIIATLLIAISYSKTVRRKSL